MRPNWAKRILWIVISGIALGGLVWFAWPQPIPVDLAMVKKGPLQITVDDEGKTHIEHVYTVSAPISGKVLRISHPTEHNQSASRHVGDQVVAGETVVAVMQPVIPSFLDVRFREELRSAVAASEAAAKLAEAEVRRIEAALAFAQSELGRAETLARTKTISVQALDKARLDVETNKAALASAKAQLEVRRSEREIAAARLIEPSNSAASTNAGCCIQILAPENGRVLRILKESEDVVVAGTPLLEIGDPLDLEIVADLLSTDAVQVKPGAAVMIDGWGGPAIRGRVNRVDPAGFLKISALGIEEQRVRVTIDFADAAEMWSRLGHDYRVVVHVVTWSAEDVLRVPVGALFRTGEDWAVFSVKDGRARTSVVKIGPRNNRMAEILSGLSEGDRVVLHPSDRVKDGTPVSERDTADRMRM